MPDDAYYTRKHSETLVKVVAYEATFLRAPLYAILKHDSNQVRRLRSICFQSKVQNEVESLRCD